MSSVPEQNTYRYRKVPDDGDYRLIYQTTISYNITKLSVPAASTFHLGHVAPAAAGLYLGAFEVLGSEYRNQPLPVPVPVRPYGQHACERCSRVNFDVVANGR